MIISFTVRKLFEHLIKKLKLFQIESWSFGKADMISNHDFKFVVYLLKLSFSRMKSNSSFWIFSIFYCRVVVMAAE